VPVPLSENPIHSGWVGTLAQVAGFGESEAGVPMTSQFLVEPIVEVDEDGIIIDGSGVSGACGGDSGGPLLVRTEGGLRVAGVLSSGATSCVGRDYYTKVSQELAWFQQWVPAATSTEVPPSRPCVLAPAQASPTCYRGGVLTCDEGGVRYESCVAPSTCGWSVELGEFACTSPEDDPCMGIDAFGVCTSTTALRCAGGQLREDTCDPCSQKCVHSATSGVVKCFTP